MPKDETKEYLRDLANFMYGLYVKSGRNSIGDVARSISYSRQALEAYLRGKRRPSREVFDRYVGELAPNDPQALEKATMLYEAACQAEAAARLGHEAPATDRRLGSPATETPRPFGELETESVLTTYYRNNAEFYAAARTCVENAEHTLRFTYIRQTPPSQVKSKEAAEYFSRILNWSTESTIGSAMRIIGIPMDADRPRPTMLDWIRQHAEATSSVSNYEFKVIPWYNNGDGLNMALIDDHTSFLAVSGESRNALDGLSFSSSRVHHYLSKHFTQLWWVAEQSDDFLARCADL